MFVRKPFVSVFNQRIIKIIQPLNFSFHFQYIYRLLQTLNVYFVKYWQNMIVWFGA